MRRPREKAEQKPSNLAWMKFWRPAIFRGNNLRVKCGKSCRAIVCVQLGETGT